MSSVDFFYSLRSPYSYLALHRLRSAVSEYPFRIDMRPVYPLQMRRPDLTGTNELFARYVPMDGRRVAEFLGVPFSFPDPDPVIRTADGMGFAPDQPLLRELLRLSVAAQMEGRGFEFAVQLMHLLWSGQAGSWRSEDRIAAAASKAGLGFERLKSTVANAPQELDEAIGENGAALVSAGHWGVPTAVFHGEPFFGQDRMDVLLWRIKQSGILDAQNAAKPDRP